MMSGVSDAQTLTAVILPKQESLQYLSVSSDTYLHWKTLMHSLGLNSDGQLASFLLQHFEKTSNLQLTQCVKCCGPVVQYCVPCNIYMTQPTTPPLPLTLLPQEGAALPVSCEDAILATDTILLELGDIDNEHVLLQDIAMKAESRTDNSGSREKGREVRAAPCTSTGRQDDPKTGTQASRLRMLLENPNKDRAEVFTANPTNLKTQTSVTPATLNPQTTVQPATLNPQTTARSLLTPSVLKNLKARAQQSWAEKALTPTPCTAEGGEDPTPPTTSSDSQPVMASQQQDPSDSVTSQQPPQTESAVQRDTQKSLSHQTTLQKLTDLLNSSSSPSTGKTSSSSSSSSSSVPEKEADCPSLIVSSLKKADVCDGVNVVIVELPPSAEKGGEQSVSVADGTSACEEASSTTGVTLEEATEHSLNAGSPARPTQSVTSADASQSAVECPPSASDLDSVASDHHSSDFKPASPAMSDTPCQKDVDASADRIRVPNPEVEEPPQNVPENPLSGDEEDSDYHCEPLFITTPAPHHPHHPLNPPSSSSSGGQRNSASQHIVDAATRTKPTRRKTTTTPARKRRRRSRPRENPDRDSTQEVDLPEKRTKLDGQVVVITEQGGGIPQPSPPPAPQDSRTAVPEGRPKRVAAAKASWTWKSVKVKDEGVGDDPEVSHANNVNEEIRDGGDDNVSDLGDVDSEGESETCGVVNAGENVEGPVKVEDVDSKVSVLLDPDLRKRAAIIAWKQKRLEDKKRRKSYPCTFCSQEFRAACDRQVHVRERHGFRPYSCTECAASYTKLTFLRAHINQYHAQVKPNLCLLCGRSFARAYDLRVHQQKRCQDRVVVCSLCGVTLKSARFMKAHMRTHNQTDKPFVCQVCGRAFRWSGNLTDHLRIHSGDKPFTCAVCGVKYVQSGSLRRHMERRHNPNRLRPFVCDICGEARFDRHQFDKHMMIHTGEKPCVCSICGAAFIQINALNDHMKIHTDQDGKPHKCPVCGAAFKILASITRHMNKVHKANTIQLSEEVVAEEIIGVQFAAADS